MILFAYDNILLFIIIITLISGIKSKGTFMTMWLEMLAFGPAENKI